MELNREQLIKAFEAYVNYNNCPEYIRDILSLIKELTEENERLRGCVKSKAEVEAIMRATYEPLVKEITKEQADKAVADTVRKMQDRLEDFATDDGKVYISTVRKIAEEMIGDKND